MNLKVAFYNQANQGRVQMQAFRSSADRYNGILFVNRAVGLAESMGIDDFPVTRYERSGTVGDDDPFLQVLFDALNYLDGIYTEFVTELDPKLNSSIVILDEIWKGKVNTYIIHIRTIITDANIEDRLKQSILSQLNNLQREVDRNQAKIDSTIQLFLDLTYAGGEGAQNLGPVTKLVKDLFLGFKRLKSAEDEQTDRPALPGPIDLGLEDLSDEGTNKEK